MLLLCAKQIMRWLVCVLQLQTQLLLLQVMTYSAAAKEAAGATAQLIASQTKKTTLYCAEVQMQILYPLSLRTTGRGGSGVRMAGLVGRFAGVNLKPPRGVCAYLRCSTGLGGF